MKQVTDNANYKTHSKIILSLAIFLFPLQVISTSQGGSVVSNVKTEGNSNVNVEQRVSTESKSTINVESNSSQSSANVRSSVTQSGDTSIKNRIEIDVNGNKQVIESDKPGTIQLEINGDQATPEPTITVIKAEYQPFQQYIVEKIQSLLKDLFFGFWRQ